MAVAASPGLFFYAWYGARRDWVWWVLLICLPVQFVALLQVCMVGYCSCSGCTS